MRPFLRLVLLCCLVSFPFVSPQAKKLTKQQQKLYVNPIPFLTLEQFARLEYSQRVRYVKEFRKTFLEAEKNQYLFRFSKLYALIDSPAKRNEIYAALFGEEAAAQSVGLEHGRGRLANDNCICAYRICDYPKNPPGARKPFLCDWPAESQCKNSKGQVVGYSCGQELSGLPEGNPEFCVPAVDRYRATELCEGIRSEMSKKNRANGEIQKALDMAKKVFKLGGANEVLPVESLESQDAQNAVAHLLKYMYDDEVYANLLYVSVIYKANTKNVAGVFQKVSASMNGYTVDHASISINEMFQKYQVHCDRPLSNAEVKSLIADNCTDSRPHQGRSTQIENVRCEKAKNIKKYLEKEGKSADQLTYEEKARNGFINRNYLEINECRILAERINERKREFEDIARRSPVISETPTVVVATDIPPPPKDIKPDTVGCSQDVLWDKDHLYQWAPRCFVCSAERALYHSDPERFNGPDSEKLGVSTKWMSLLSTMVLACGEGAIRERTGRKANSDNVTLENFAKYLYTFGHCSNHTYEWDSHPLSEKQRRLLKEWSDSEYWSNNAGAKDVNEDFKAVYGVSYETATKIFCDPKKFKKTLFRRKIKDFDPKYQEPSLGMFMYEGRKRLAQHKQVRPDTPIDTPADRLKECMDESLANAEKLYSNNSENCMSFSWLGGRNQDSLLRGLEERISNSRGGILANSGQCWNAHQLEAKGREKAIAFLDPAQTTGSYHRIRVFEPEGEASEQPSRRTFIESPDGTREMKIGPDVGSPQGVFRVSYPTASACPIGQGVYKSKRPPKELRTTK